MTGSSRTSRQQSSRGRGSRKRGKGSRGGYLPRSSNAENAPSPPSDNANLETISTCPSQSTPGGSGSQAHGSNSQARGSMSQAQDGHPDVTPDSVLGSIAAADLEEVRKERDEAIESCNNYKQELQKLRVDLAHATTTNTILREKVEMLQTELANERMEKKSLELLNSQLSQPSQRTTHNQGTKSSIRFINKLTKSIDRKYISLASSVERLLHDWAHAETMEVIQTDESVKRRNWTGRMTIVQDFGIPCNSEAGSDGENYLIVPTLITSVLNSSDVFYIRSFNSYGDVLQTIVQTLLQETSWAAFAPNDLVKAATIRSISTNPVMLGKVKQCLSDATSNRKRLVRDELFQQLRYFSLKSSHDRRRETPLFDKVEEISLAKQKILGQALGQTSSTSRHSVEDYSRWRTQPLEDLTCDGVVPEMFNDDDIKMDKPVAIKNAFDDDNLEEMATSASDRDRFQKTCLGLFTNPLSVHILHLFLGYNPHSDMDNISETSIVVLTRLDAWIATVLQLLVPSEKRGGGRQRDYNHFFHQNHICSMHQLIQSIYDFVNYWEPGELRVPNVDSNNYRAAVCNMNRTATRLLHCGLQNAFFIAVRSDWFNTYISSCIGTVHDCYIAKVSDDWSTIIPLTTTAMWDSRPMDIHDQQPSIPNPAPSSATTSRDTAGTSTIPIPLENERRLSDQVGSRLCPIDDAETEDRTEYHEEDDISPETVPPRYD